MKKAYIHEVFYYNEDGSYTEKFDTIITKKEFRKAMIKHYFEDDGGPLVFYLINSPNKKVYKVIPYVGTRGKKSICFSALMLERKENV